MRGCSSGVLRRGCCALIGKASRPCWRWPGTKRHVGTDRTIATTDPSDDGDHIWDGDDEGRRPIGIRMSGFNTGRGSMAETSASLLYYDTDGARTALVSPNLS